MTRSAHGVTGDDRAERARAKLGRFLHHIVEARALERREEVMQVGALFLRAGLVVETGFSFFPANGAELGPPLPVLAVEQQEVVASLESEHVSEVMRLVLAQRDHGARFKPGGDEQALELGGHGGTRVKDDGAKASST